MRTLTHSWSDHLNPGVPLHPDSLLLCTPAPSWRGQFRRSRGRGLNGTWNNETDKQTSKIRLVSPTPARLNVSAPWTSQQQRSLIFIIHHPAANSAKPPAIPAAMEQWNRRTDDTDSPWFPAAVRRFNASNPKMRTRDARPCSSCAARINESADPRVSAAAMEPARLAPQVPSRRHGSGCPGLRGGAGRAWRSPIFPMHRAIQPHLYQASSGTMPPVPTATQLV